MDIKLHEICTLFLALRIASTIFNSRRMNHGQSRNISPFPDPRPSVCLLLIVFVLQGHDMDGSVDHVTKYYVPLPNKSDCNDSYCVNLRFLCGDGSCGMFSGNSMI